jgi:hypothetical protein
MNEVPRPNGSARLSSTIESHEQNAGGRGSRTCSDDPASESTLLVGFRCRSEVFLGSIITMSTPYERQACHPHKRVYCRASQAIELLTRATEDSVRHARGFMSARQKVTMYA